jgi:hypothetical protein
MPPYLAISANLLHLTITNIEISKLIKSSNNFQTLRNY